MIRAQVFEITIADELADDSFMIIGYVFSFNNDPRGPLCTLDGDGLSGAVTGTRDLICNGRAVTATHWGEREFFTGKEAAAIMGSARSERKAAAARENGRRGGRPRKPSPTTTGDSQS